MRMRHRVVLLTVIALCALPVLAAGQSLPYPTDPQTGRAVGANELAAQELKQQLDSGEKVLLIDVREEPLYEKETIPGAIHIGLTGANAGKFTVRALTKNYTFWPLYLLRR